MKYYDLATERRAEFEKAMNEYNKKKVDYFICILHIYVHLYHIFSCMGSCLSCFPMQENSETSNMCSCFILFPM